MTTGRPNAAYAGQVVHFPDPVRSAAYPNGVRVDGQGFPDFGPYAQAVAEVADPPAGFGVDELRLTDYVSANAALHASGHELWADAESSVVTPAGWTWHHSVGPAQPGSRRMELVPVEVKALLRHHGGLVLSTADHAKRGTRPLQERRPVHFPLAPLQSPNGPRPRTVRSRPRLPTGRAASARRGCSRPRRASATACRVRSGRS